MELLNNIENIIFDFGGVVFEINPQLTVDAFIKMGLEKIGNNYSKLEQFELFEKFETGKINSSQFYDEIRKIAGKKISDFEINLAWNKMLIRMPEENIEILRSLKQKYNCFLLSNTNEIHCKRFEQIIHGQHGIFLSSLFHKIYYSHLLKCRKPDLEIFKKVLDENKITAQKTLFVDDSPRNIEGAKFAGFKTLYLTNGQTLKQVFC